MNDLSDPASPPRETALVYFSPEDYFVGLAMKAMAKGRDVRIAPPKGGAVSIFPSRGGYCSTMMDEAAFCRTPASHFEITPLGEAEGALLRSTLPLRNISELLWLAAFHAAHGRLVDSGTGSVRLHLNDVIQFTHWPNLSRLPTTLNTMRMCALLTRQPSAIFFIPRKLGIPVEEVLQVCSAAHCSGMVRVLSNFADAQAAGGATPPSRPDLLRALLVRLMRP